MSDRVSKEEVEKAIGNLHVHSITGEPLRSQVVAATLLRRLLSEREDLREICSEIAPEGGGLRISHDLADRLRAALNNDTFDLKMRVRDLEIELRGVQEEMEAEIARLRAEIEDDRQIMVSEHGHAASDLCGYCSYCKEYPAVWSSPLLCARCLCVLKKVGECKHHPKPPWWDDHLKSIEGK